MPVPSLMIVAYFQPFWFIVHRQTDRITDAGKRLKARSDRRASTLHKLNERCQFKLYIGYWTSNKNKWLKCSCQTPPDNTCTNDVIDNAMT